MSGFDTSKTLTVRFVGDTSRLNKSFGTAYREAQGFGQKMAVVGGQLKGMVGPALLAAGAAAGAFAVKLGVDAVKGAAAEQIELNKLQTALDNVGQGFRRKEVDDFITQLQMATGKSDSELRPALQQLITTTGDVGQAMDLMNVAMDVAAARNVDVATAADALAKAAGGSTKAIGSLTKGAIDPAILKSGNLAKIIDALNEKFGGQSAAAADTFAGKIARIEQSVSELSDSFGTGFISSFESADGSVDKLQKSINDLQPVMEDLGRQVGDVVRAFAELGPIGQGILRFVFAVKGPVLILKDFIIALRDGQSAIDAFIIAMGGASGAQESHREATDESRRRVALFAAEIRAQNEVVGTAAVKFDDLTSGANRSSDAMLLLREDIRLTTRSLGPLAAAFDEANAAMDRRESMQNYRDALKEFISDASKQTLADVESAAIDMAQSFDDPKQQAKFIVEAMDAISAAAKDAGMKVPPEFQAMYDAALIALDPVAALKKTMEEIPEDIFTTIHVTEQVTGTGRVIATGGPVYATGGMVRAALGTHASDNIPAMLSRGEYVLNADTVKRLGIGGLNRINNGGALGGSGLVIEQLNVTAATGERAEESVPRALRRMAFVAGLNG